VFVLFGYRQAHGVEEDHIWPVAGGAVANAAAVCREVRLQVALRGLCSSYVGQGGSSTRCSSRLHCVDCCARVARVVVVALVLALAHAWGLESR